MVRENPFVAFLQLFPPSKFQARRKFAIQRAHLTLSKLSLGHCVALKACPSIQALVVIPQWAFKMSIWYVAIIGETC